ncbi:MAG: OmpA family protein [Kiritimatiellae bacterium]|nr:OmpA family protein [Kiritimatiellia bacterium]
MKFSTIMAVMTVGIAVVAAGCRYDKIDEEGPDGVNGAVDLDTNETDPFQEGNLDDLTREGKHFDELYTRCTDVSFMPVYFGFDSTVVPQGELSKIEAVASHLASNADRVVIVAGHCDERGSDEYNMSLGENRSIIVRNYLVENGITADRIETRSYGKERPAVVGDGEEFWCKNRRAEFEIFQK